MKQLQSELRKALARTSTSTSSEGSAALQAHPYSVAVCDPRGTTHAAARADGAEGMAYVKGNAPHLAKVLTPIPWQVIHARDMERLQTELRKALSSGGGGGQGDGGGARSEESDRAWDTAVREQLGDVRHAL